MAKGKPFGDDETMMGPVILCREVQNQPLLRTSVMKYLLQIIALFIAAQSMSAEPAINVRIHHAHTSSLDMYLVEAGTTEELHLRAIPAQHIAVQQAAEGDTLVFKSSDLVKRYAVTAEPKQLLEFPTVMREILNDSDGPVDVLVKVKLSGVWSHSVLRNLPAHKATQLTLFPSNYLLFEKNKVELGSHTVTSEPDGKILVSSISLESPGLDDSDDWGSVTNSKGDGSVKTTQSNIPAPHLYAAEQHKQLIVPRNGSNKDWTDWLAVDNQPTLENATDVQEGEINSSFAGHVWPPLRACLTGYNFYRMNPAELATDTGKTQETTIFRLMRRGDVDWHNDFGISVPNFITLVAAKQGVQIDSSTIHTSEWQRMRSFGVGFQAGGKGVGFGASYDHSLRTKALRTNTRVESSSYETLYWAYLNKQKLQLSQPFKTAVETLKTSKDKKDFKEFFERFGTHYPIATLVGARGFSLDTISKSGMERLIHESGSLEAGVKGPIAIIKGSAKYGQENGNSNSEERRHHMANHHGGSLQGNSLHVTDTDCVPVDVLLRPVTELVHAELFDYEEDKATVKMSEKAVKKAEALIIQFNDLRAEMERQLVDYKTDNKVPENASENAIKVFRVTAVADCVDGFDGFIDPSIYGTCSIHVTNKQGNNMEGWPKTVWEVDRATAAGDPDKYKRGKGQNVLTETEIVIVRNIDELTQSIKVSFDMKDEDDVGDDGHIACTTQAIVLSDVVKDENRKVSWHSNNGHTGYELNLSSNLSFGISDVFINGLEELLGGPTFNATTSSQDGVGKYSARNFGELSFSFMVEEIDIEFENEEIVLPAPPPHLRNAPRLTEPVAKPPSESKP